MTSPAAKDHQSCIALCDYPKGKTKSHLKKHPVLFQDTKDLLEIFYV